MNNNKIKMKKVKVLKKENGITIISLVITIIVMLILAGVSVNLMLKDNDTTHGVVTEVKDQTNKQQEQIKKEEEKMNSVLKNQEKDWGISE